MILSEQREGSGADRGSSSSARLGPGEGKGDNGLRRPTHNRPRGKRVWKAYHERQVLLAKDRQRSRAVCGESGDDHRRLPDVDGRTAGVAAVAAARNQPSAVRFNREGVEFTADSLGANGCFIDVYNRCGCGSLKARTVGACRHAAGGKRGRDREKEEQLKPNSPGPRTRLLRRGDAAAIKSGSASGSGGIPEVKASVLRHGDGNWDDDRKGTRGNYRKPKRSPHPCPCIGPGSHSLDYGQVANVYEERPFAESEGAETSVSRYLKDRRVMTALDGGWERRKLRGAVTAERREMARTVTKKRFSDRVVEREKNASLYGSGDDGESICSVLSFEDMYAKTTQVTDALATVERARESEPVKPVPSRRPRAAANGGGGRRVDGDWREQQRRARAASRSEIASVATDPNDTTLLDRRRSSGSSVAPTVDGDSVDDTVSNLDSVSHDLQEFITAPKYLSSSLDLDGLRTEGGISEEADGGIFPPLNRLRRRGSRGRASSSWTSVARAKVEAAAFAVAGAADDSADSYGKCSTPAAPSDGVSLATVAGAPRSMPGVGSAGGLSETGGRGISASRWPIERKKPSVGVSGSAAEELEGSGVVAEDLPSISTAITVIAAASKGERSSQAPESTVDSVVTTAAGNSSALDFTLGSVDSPSGIGSAVAGIGPATESVSKWTGSRGRGRPRRPKQRKGGIGLESSDWRRRGAPPRLPRINLGSKKLQFMKWDTRRDVLIEACEWGDLEALKQLLGLGASPLDAYSTTNSAGSRCVLGEFFLFLLQSKGMTALHHAADTGWTPMCLYLLLAGGEAERAGRQRQDAIRSLPRGASESVRSAERVCSFATAP